MSICGVDGGIAPIAPGPLSSIKDTIKYDLSVIIIETKVLNKKEKTESIKSECRITTKHENRLPKTIRINTFIDPITREQMIEII